MVTHSEGRIVRERGGREGEGVTVREGESEVKEGGWEGTNLLES